MEKRGSYRKIEWAGLIFTKKWEIELDFRKIEAKSVIASKKAVPTIR
jgi:hypothetical protein